MILTPFKTHYYHHHQDHHHHHHNHSFLHCHDIVSDGTNLISRPLVYKFSWNQNYFDLRFTHIVDNLFSASILLHKLCLLRTKLTVTNVWKMASGCLASKTCGSWHLLDMVPITGRGQVNWQQWQHLETLPSWLASLRSLLWKHMQSM